MGKKKRKTNTAFLSFANPDRELAKALSQLFYLAQECAYFAPEDLGKAGTPKWRDEIISQIKDSYSIIPIYTRHSIRRPWVLYESGVADAFGPQRFPAIVSGVSTQDIDYLPSGSGLYFDLSEGESLVNLVTNACVQRGGSRSEVEARIRKTCIRHAKVVNLIIGLAKKRWVFVAGNTVNDPGRSDSGVDWYTTTADYENRLREFSESLTELLLENGFSIAACPQVRSLGMHVTERAMSCLDTKHYEGPVEFRIAGIHPIDREAREIKLSSETAKKKWLDHIMAFRGTYLENQEWLVLIGGNDGTQEEFQAATKCGVKTFAVPCFGGTAMRVFNKHKSLRIEPCARCTTRDGQCGDVGIKGIVGYLKKACLTEFAT